MNSIKDILVKPILSAAANDFVKKHHYSKSYVRNSQIHLGAFLNNKLHGVMQFGPSMDKNKLIKLVHNTRWNGFIELNRMAFDEQLPRNSESRCIGIALRLLKKHYPFIKWAVSFADCCMCGDGTIYRASGFYLTNIKENKNMYQLPNGTVLNKFTLETGAYRLRSKSTKNSYFKEHELKPITGYQLRYIKLLDAAVEKDINFPIIPYSKLKEMGIDLYKGQPRQKKAMDEEQSLSQRECDTHLAAPIHLEKLTCNKAVLEGK